MASEADFTAPGCYTQLCRLRASGDDEVYGGSDNNMIAMSASMRATAVAVAWPTLRPATQ
jgi:hypothetical protein